MSYTSYGTYITRVNLPRTVNHTHKVRFPCPPASPKATNQQPAVVPLCKYMFKCTHPTYRHTAIDPQARTLPQHAQRNHRPQQRAQHCLCRSCCYISYNAPTSSSSGAEAVDIPRRPPVQLVDTTAGLRWRRSRVFSDALGSSVVAPTVALVLLLFTTEACTQANLLALLAVSG